GKAPSARRSVRRLPALDRMECGSSFLPVRDIDLCRKAQIPVPAERSSAGGKETRPAHPARGTGTAPCRGPGKPLAQALSRPRKPPRASNCALRQSRISSRRSEEHTSELQSRENLVCRLL